MRPPRRRPLTELPGAQPLVEPAFRSRATVPQRPRLPEPSAQTLFSPESLLAHLRPPSGDSPQVSPEKAAAIAARRLAAPYIGELVRRLKPTGEDWPRSSSVVVENLKSTRMATLLRRRYRLPVAEAVGEGRLQRLVLSTLWSLKGEASVIYQSWVPEGRPPNYPVSLWEIQLAGDEDCFANMRADPFTTPPFDGPGANMAEVPGFGEALAADIETLLRASAQAPQNPDSSPPAGAVGTGSI